LDFRVNNNKEVFFLEINFTCSVFYKDGFEGSADFILKYDGICQKGFLEQIIREGMFRHKKNQKPFYVKGNASSGYGIYSKNKLDGGVVIFSGEEKSQKIVTRRFVEKNWKEKDKKTFRQYAYPLSSEVFILWSDNPSDWAPQNHSCNPNTKYDGLNVITTRVINKNEELTLDYAEFLDEYMEPFNCSCGEPCCRKHIIGRKNNSVTARESI
jgi:D-alanine-D-alanine ligase